MPLYSSLVRHQIAGLVFLEKCREMDDAAFCRTERKTLLTHLQSQQHFNWFRLDSDGAHKVHKCTSNISLYCGFKELSVKGLKTAMHIECTSAHSNISLYCGFKELSVKA